MEGPWWKDFIRVSLFFMVFFKIFWGKAAAIRQKNDIELIFHKEISGDTLISNFHLKKLEHLTNFPGYIMECNTTFFSVKPRKLIMLPFSKRAYSVLTQLTFTDQFMDVSYLKVAKTASPWEGHITHKGRSWRWQWLIDHDTFTWECSSLLLLAFPKFL